MENTTYKIDEKGNLLRLVDGEYYLSIGVPNEGDTISFTWNELTVFYTWMNFWDKVSEASLDKAARRKVNSLKADIQVAKQDGTLVTYKYDESIPTPTKVSHWPLTETVRLVYLD